ncbi:MAG TPA: MarR family winged helix-turn-helix transcriptional regulator [Solirubrobacteraceae bacterium]|jgi:DNA-binding MarR family transcriptional regulator
MAQTSPHRSHDAIVSSSAGLPQWSPDYAAAWIGLLATHRSLTRELDAELEASHGLTLSGLELLVRLANTPDHWLRLSALAHGAGLSLSRVSRIVDVLEVRGLLKRRPCDADARAINAVLTPAGLELAAAAQATHLAAVRERFFDRLSEAEVSTLATIFMRFSPEAVGACTS